MEVSRWVADALGIWSPTNNSDVTERSRHLRVDGMLPARDFLQSPTPGSERDDDSSAAVALEAAIDAMDNLYRDPYYVFRVVAVLFMLDD